MGPPELSAVVVGYRSRKYLPGCLRSVVEKGGVADPEIIVVDNGSRDGTVEMLRRDFPGVTVIANRENLGFARAANQGLRLASGRYLLLINPDMVVLENALAELVGYLGANADCGMAGGNGLDTRGRPQPQFTRAIPTPLTALFHFCGLDRLFPQSRLFGRYNYTYADRGETFDVEAVSGSCMLVRREALEQVGPLDERFGMYAEDLDWCLRFARAGWRISYVHTARFIHFHGRSSKKNLLWTRKQFYLTMRAFYKKNLRGFYPWPVDLLVDAGILAALGLGLARAYLSGV
jgi:GT2 family glycosyltransferase